jgi:hypothetical protein
MGSKAHRLPMFHLAGVPSERIQKLGRATHHIHGDTVDDRFQPISASACCVCAVLKPVPGELNAAVEDPSWRDCNQPNASLTGSISHGRAIIEEQLQKSSYTTNSAAMGLLTRSLDDAAPFISMCGVFHPHTSRSYRHTGHIDKMISRTE